MERDYLERKCSYKGDDDFCACEENKAMVHLWVKTPNQPTPIFFSHSQSFCNLSKSGIEGLLSYKLNLSKEFTLFINLKGLADYLDNLLVIDLEKNDWQIVKMELKPHKRVAPSSALFGDRYFIIFGIFPLSIDYERSN